MLGVCVYCVVEIRGNQIMGVCGYCAVENGGN
jgi:hypothetical protein